VLLDRLLANLTVDVEPFAVCEVSPGWRLRLNGAGFVMLHYVLEGEGHLSTPQGSLPLSEYSLAVVPPGVPHSIDSGEPIASETTTDDVGKQVGAIVQFLAGPRRRNVLVVVCGRLTVSYGGGPGLFDLLQEPLVLDFSDSTQMREVFTHLLEEEGNLSPGAEVMMTSLLRQCLVLVLRRLCEDPQCTLPWLAALDDPRLAQVLDRVLDDPGQPYTVESLAAEAFMSRSAFVAQFTGHFGQTPMAFVRQVRLRRGAELLRTTGLSVEAVAHQVGYASRSHFSHAFREYFGHSPAAERSP
jgi:AraC-like DNA-binding protein